MEAFLKEATKSVNLIQFRREGESLQEFESEEDLLLKRILNKSDEKNCKKALNSCLIDFLRDNVSYFDHGQSKEGILKMEVSLKQWQTIIEHHVSNDSSLRGIFVKHTAIFKEYFINHPDKKIRQNNQLNFVC